MPGAHGDVPAGRFRLEGKLDGVLIDWNISFIIISVEVEVNQAVKTNVVLYNVHNI